MQERERYSALSKRRSLTPTNDPKRPTLYVGTGDALHRARSKEYNFDTVRDFQTVDVLREEADQSAQRGQR